MSDNPVANLGDLTKAATVLVEKIADAVGGFFQPFQVVRLAKAEAKAELIRSENKIEITDQERRAAWRWLKEEAKRQANMEDITRGALPLLAEKASPQDVENDWITHFFEKSRIVSDDDMQRLWSRVLAGEANVPGSFSRRTVNVLADIDKFDAELFTRLCGFGWMVEGHELPHLKGTSEEDRPHLVPLVFDASSQIYRDSGIDFQRLFLLQNLGLIQFDSLGIGFIWSPLPQTTTVSYHGRVLELTLRAIAPKHPNNALVVGQVLLTRAGRELASIISPAPVEGFFDFVRDRWVRDSLLPEAEVGPHETKSQATAASKTT
jgi:hypothetical protein